MSEMIPEFGGCSWPVDPACLGDDWDLLEPEVQQRALSLASSALRALTAYRVGACPVTIRPCSPRCCSGFSQYEGDWINPNLYAGTWTNGCGCQSDCNCSTVCEIKLPGPVGEVYSIRSDGVELDLADFRLDNGNILVWQGEGPCPLNVAQNLSLPDTEVGTLSITYQNSFPVDSTGAVAAAYLAYEFAKACKPKAKCSLPRGVTNVVRNGVSFTLEAGLFPNGLTGLDIVDAFITKWNPDARTQPTKVWAPGMPTHRRTRSLT